MQPVWLLPASNTQPYRFIWIESPEIRKQAAASLHEPVPRETASALVVAVADIGSWRSTHKSHLEWMRSAGFSPEEISEREKKSGFAKWFFLQGWFGCFGYLKALILRLIHFRKIIGDLARRPPRPLPMGHEKHRPSPARI